MTAAAAAAPTDEGFSLTSLFNEYVKPFLESNLNIDFSKGMDQDWGGVAGNAAVLGVGAMAANMLGFGPAASIIGGFATKFLLQQTGLGDTLQQKVGLDLGFKP
jgi:hypothetical protein